MRGLIRAGLAVVIVLSSFSAVQAATYYVSPNGDDQIGTIKFKITMNRSIHAWTDSCGIGGGDCVVFFFCGPGRHVLREPQWRRFQERRNTSDGMENVS